MLSEPRSTCLNCIAPRMDPDYSDKAAECAALFGFAMALCLTRLRVELTLTRYRAATAIVANSLIGLVKRRIELLVFFL